MVKGLFNNSRSFLFKKQTSILSAAAVLASTYLASALLGLLRDRLLAGYFLPHELGIYWVADRIPSFVFNLAVIGALSSSFIPVFTFYLGKKEEGTAFLVAAIMINLTLLVFSLFSLLAVLTTVPIAKFIAPQGASSTEVKLLSSLMRLLFLAQFFLLLSNFLTSLLQSYQRFIIPALAPVAYNLGVILGIILLGPSLGIYSAAWGTILGAFLHLGLQLPLARFLGFRYSFSFNFRHPGVVEMVKLAVPRIFGLAANQITALIDVVLATSLSFAAVTYFTFAQHLQNLPVSLLGVAFAQAALPSLSLQVGEKNRLQFKKLFTSSFSQMAFLIFPASVALFVLRLPAVRLAFGAGRFNWEATVTTGYVLAFFSLSIFAQALSFLVSRGFYALHDTRTPVKIAVATVFLNILLSVLFIKGLKLDVWSLGFSFSLSSLINFLLLVFFLDRKIGRFERASLLYPFMKICLASLLMALSMYLPLKIFDKGAWGRDLPFLPFSLPATFDILILDTRYTKNLILLTLLTLASGFSVYLFSTYLLGLAEVRFLFFHLRRLVNSFSRLFNKASGPDIPSPLPPI